MYFFHNLSSLYDTPFTNKWTTKNVTVVRTLPHSRSPIRIVSSLRKIWFFHLITSKTYHTVWVHDAWRVEWWLCWISVVSIFYTGWPREGGNSQSSGDAFHFHTCSSFEIGLHRHWSCRKSEFEVRHIGVRRRYLWRCSHASAASGIHLW